VRQYNHITHLLVRLAGVQTHAHVNFHSRVEAGVSGFFRQRNGGPGFIVLFAVYFGLCGLVFLTVLCHEYSFVVPAGSLFGHPPTFL